MKVNDYDKYLEISAETEFEGNIFNFNFLDGRQLVEVEVVQDSEDPSFSFIRIRKATYRKGVKA